MRKGRTPEQVRRLAVDHGHSTPQMAGALARHAAAKRLVMTHFGPKYPGDNGKHSRRVMGEVRALAQQQFDGEVYTAHDFMRLELYHHGGLDVSHALPLDTYDGFGQPLPDEEGPPADAQREARRPADHPGPPPPSRRPPAPRRHRPREPPGPLPFPGE